MPIDLSQLKIMLVEDDLAMRNLIKQLLQAFEVGRIEEFNNAQDALREITESKPDIVIADWMMEPMDGLTFARNIRILKNKIVRTVPIIMLTGHTERRRVEQARDSGVNEYLAKPVSASAMYARLQSVIERPRAFIDTRTYHGPDRRRKQITLPEGMEDRRGRAGDPNDGPTDGVVFEISDDE